ncbi:MAG TPA: ornithine cyclodeaminase family protein [Vicinamibacteria bacterium]|nr:ornithine cyclodeaminase family protein [Vicinamibacteria bacterium]
MRIIGEQDLRKVVREREAFEAVTRAFRALAEERAEQPAPMSFDFPDCAGEVHVKGAAIRGAPIFAVKIASGFYRNPERGLPTSSGLVLVLSQTTGTPLALLHDNAYLTEMRTAAAGALAVELLTPRNTDRMAVLGSGAQARYQLRAIARVRTLRSVIVWSPTRAHVERYCAEMREELGIPCSAADDATEAVRDAHLVLTVTSARKPIVRVEDVLESATLIAVGSDGPAKQELDEKILAKADKIVVDRRSQCAALGELHHALVAGLVREEDVYAELGDIVIGRKAGREADELIVCDLTGVGVQDAAIAETAWGALTNPDAPGR